MITVCGLCWPNRERQLNEYLEGIAEDEPKDNDRCGICKHFNTKKGWCGGYGVCRCGLWRGMIKNEESEACSEFKYKPSKK